MNYSRRNFFKFLAAVGLSQLGCEQQNLQDIENSSRPQIPQIVNSSANLRRRVSYKLEDLCDTEVE